MECGVVHGGKSFQNFKKKCGQVQSKELEGIIRLGNISTIYRHALAA